MSDLSAFEDLLAANEAYAASFPHADVPGRAATGLAVVTCMDARIDPAAILGLAPGDAKVLRNAGGRVTDEVLKALVVGTALLGVTRVLVMPHTRCRMVQESDEAVHDAIRSGTGVDTRSVVFGTAADQAAALEQDLTRIRTHPLLPRDLTVLGLTYDVTTGHLR